MKALESIVFLAICATIPTLMIGVLVYRAVRWMIVRGGWRETLAKNGWSGGGDDALVRVALEDAGVSVRRASFSWLATREGAFVAKYRRRAPGQRSGDTRRVLIVPRDVEGASGVLQPRVGGLLEKAALAMAKAFVAEPKDFEGWEWALVFPRGEEWLRADASPALRDFLGDGEVLAFGPGWVVLSLRDGEMPELLGRLDALRSAIGDPRVE